MKVVLVDSSMLFHSCVYTWAKNMTEKSKDATSAISMYISSLFSVLAKIGLNEEDIVILSEEGHSWRKDYYSPYKAQRAERRDKDVFDWKEQYKKFNECHETLKNATNWNFVREWKYCEADDIISIASRYFKNNEVIIVSGDKDLFQLSYYPNVKMFSLNKKFKKSKGCYEKVKNPLKIISDKMAKGDISDNIIVDPENDDEIMIDLRRYIIDLLKLPFFVNKAGLKAIKKELKREKKTNILQLSYLENIPYLETRFKNIYNGSKKITEEECFEEINEKLEEYKEKVRLKRRIKK